MQAHPGQEQSYPASRDVKHPTIDMAILNMHNTDMAVPRFAGQADPMAANGPTLLRHIQGSGLGDEVD